MATETKKKRQYKHHRGPGRPKLSATQKAINASAYKSIRKSYNKTVATRGNPYDMTYKQFKNRVYATRGTVDMNTGKVMNLTRAIKKVSNSTSFVPVKTRLVENAIKGLKNKFPGRWEEIKRFCVDKNGKPKSVEASMGWSGEKDMYIVTNGKGERLGVSFVPSPEDVILIKMNN